MAKMLTLVTSSESRKRRGCMGQLEWSSCWWQAMRPANFNLCKLCYFRVWNSKATTDVLCLNDDTRIGKVRSGGGLKYQLFKEAKELDNILKEDSLLKPEDGRAIVLLRGDNVLPEELKSNVNNICNLFRDHGHEVKSASHSKGITKTLYTSTDTTYWSLMMSLRYEGRELPGEDRVSAFDKIWNKFSAS